MSAIWLSGERFHAWPSGDPGSAQRVDLDGSRRSRASSSTGCTTSQRVPCRGRRAGHRRRPGAQTAARPIPAGYDIVDDDPDPTEVVNAVDDGDGHVDRAYGRGTFVAGVIYQLAANAMMRPMGVLDDEGVAAWRGGGRHRVRRGVRRRCDQPASRYCRQGELPVRQGRAPPRLGRWCRGGRRRRQPR